jgi:hypothetical protein
MKGLLSAAVGPTLLADVGGLEVSAMVGTVMVITATVLVVSLVIVLLVMGVDPLNQDEQLKIHVDSDDVIVQVRVWAGMVGVSEDVV